MAETDRKDSDKAAVPPAVEPHPSPLDLASPLDLGDLGAVIARGEREAEERRAAPTDAQQLFLQLLADARRQGRPIRLLAICNQNIYRSPAIHLVVAEAIKRLNDEGIHDVTIESAGVAAVRIRDRLRRFIGRLRVTIRRPLGLPVIEKRPILEVAREFGVSEDTLASLGETGRVATPQMIEDATVIIAAGRAQRHWIRQHAPEAARKTVLFTELIPTVFETRNRRRSLPDPAPQEDHMTTEDLLAEIRSAAPPILERLLRPAPPAATPASDDPSGSATERASQPTIQRGILLPQGRPEGRSHRLVGAEAASPFFADGPAGRRFIHTPKSGDAPQPPAPAPPATPRGQGVGGSRGRGDVRHRLPAGRPARRAPSTVQMVEGIEIGVGDDIDDEPLSNPEFSSRAQVRHLPKPTRRRDPTPDTAPATPGTGTKETRPAAPPDDQALPITPRPTGTCVFGSTALQNVVSQGLGEGAIVYPEGQVATIRVLAPYLEQFFESEGRQSSIPLGFLNGVLWELNLNARASDQEATAAVEFFPSTEILRAVIVQRQSDDADWERLQANRRGVQREGLAYLTDQKQRWQDGASSSLEDGRGLFKFRQLVDTTDALLIYRRDPAPPHAVVTTLYVQQDPAPAFTEPLPLKPSRRTAAPTVESDTDLKIQHRSVNGILRGLKVQVAQLEHEVGRREPDMVAPIGTAVRHGVENAVLHDAFPRVEVVAALRDTGQSLAPKLGDRWLSVLEILVINALRVTQGDSRPTIRIETGLTRTRTGEWRDYLSVSGLTHGLPIAGPMPVPLERPAVIGHHGHDYQEAQTIVESANGSLSRNDQGTTFTVSFETKPSPDQIREFEARLRTSFEENLQDVRRQELEDLLDIWSAGGSESALALPSTYAFGRTLFREWLGRNPPATQLNPKTGLTTGEEIFVECVIAPFKELFEPFIHPFTFWAEHPRAGWILAIGILALLAVPAAALYYFTPSDMFHAAGVRNYLLMEAGIEVLGVSWLMHLLYAVINRALGLHAALTIGNDKPGPAPPAGPSQPTAPHDVLAGWARAPEALPITLKDAPPGTYVGDAAEERLSEDEVQAIRRETAELMRGKSEGASLTLTMRDRSLDMTLVRINHLTFLLPSDWHGTLSISQGSLGALLEKALDGLPPEERSLLDPTTPFVILPVAHLVGEDHADHLAGDHVKNGIIFLHQRLPVFIQRLNAQLPDTGNALLQVLLEHELRHEATGATGASVEAQFTVHDARRLATLLRMPVAEAADTLLSHGLISHEFWDRLTRARAFLERRQNLHHLWLRSRPRLGRSQLGWPLWWWTRVHQLTRGWLVRMRGLEHLPKPLSERFLLASNHPLHGFEGVAITTEIILGDGRFPRFVANPSRYRLGRLAQRLTGWGGALAVRSPRGTLKVVLSHLGEPGAVIGFFPAGRPYASLEEDLKNWRKGIARAALEAGVPIVPTFVSVRRRLPPLTISFGPPVSPVDESGTLKTEDELLEEVKAAVRKLAASASTRPAPSRRLTRLFRLLRRPLLVGVPLAVLAGLLAMQFLGGVGSESEPEILVQLLSGMGSEAGPRILTAGLPLGAGGVKWMAISLLVAALTVALSRFPDGTPPGGGLQPIYAVLRSRLTREKTYLDGLLRHLANPRTQPPGTVLASFGDTVEDQSLFSYVSEPWFRRLRGRLVDDLVGLELSASAVHQHTMPTTDTLTVEFGRMRDRVARALRHVENASASSARTGPQAGALALWKRFRWTDPARNPKALLLVGVIEGILLSLVGAAGLLWLGQMPQGPSSDAFAFLRATLPDVFLYGLPLLFLAHFFDGVLQPGTKPPITRNGIVAGLATLAAGTSLVAAPLLAMAWMQGSVTLGVVGLVIATQHGWMLNEWVVIRAKRASLEAVNRNLRDLALVPHLTEEERARLDALARTSQELAAPGMRRALRRGWSPKDPVGHVVRDFSELHQAITARVGEEQRQAAYARADEKRTEVLKEVEELERMVADDSLNALERVVHRYVDREERAYWAGELHQKTRWVYEAILLARHRIRDAEAFEKSDQPQRSVELSRVAISIMSGAARNFTDLRTLLRGVEKEWARTFPWASWVRQTSWEHEEDSQILGIDVDVGASPEEIRRRYQELASQWDPQVVAARLLQRGIRDWAIVHHPEYREAERQFHVLQEAYLRLGGREQTHGFVPVLGVGMGSVSIGWAVVAAVALVVAIWELRRLSLLHWSWSPRWHRGFGRGIIWVAIASVFLLFGRAPLIAPTLGQYMPARLLSAPQPPGPPSLTWQVRPPRIGSSVPEYLAYLNFLEVEEQFFSRTNDVKGLARIRMRYELIYAAMQYMSLLPPGVEPRAAGAYRALTDILVSRVLSRAREADVPQSEIAIWQWIQRFEDDLRRALYPSADTLRATLFGFEQTIREESASQRRVLPVTPKPAPSSPAFRGRQGLWRDGLKSLGWLLIGTASWELLWRPALAAVLGAEVPGTFSALGSTGYFGMPALGLPGWAGHGLLALAGVGTSVLGSVRDFLTPIFFIVSRNPDVAMWLGLFLIGPGASVWLIGYLLRRWHLHPDRWYDPDAQDKARVEAKLMWLGAIFAVLGAVGWYLLMSWLSPPPAGPATGALVAGVVGLPPLAVRRRSARQPRFWDQRLAERWPEPESQALSREVVRELSILQPVSPERTHVPSMFRFGASRYGRERWDWELPRKLASQPVRRGAALARMGPLFFMDQEAYRRLNDSLPGRLGWNAMLVDDLPRGVLSDNNLADFSLMTVMAMLHSPLKGKLAIDAGSGDAMLSLAAARLGAGPLVLIEQDPTRMRQARENLNLNGLLEGEDYFLLPLDVRKTEAILRHLPPAAHTRDIAILSNIGTWQKTYPEVTNQHSLALARHLPRVTLVIGGGYVIGFSRVSRLIRDDLEYAEELGFEVDRRIAKYDHSSVTVASWVATKPSQRRSILRLPTAQSFMSLPTTALSVVALSVSWFAPPGTLTLLTLLGLGLGAVAMVVTGHAGGGHDRPGAAQFVQLIRTVEEKLRGDLLGTVHFHDVTMALGRLKRTGVYPIPFQWVAPPDRLVIDSPALEDLGLLLWAASSRRLSQDPSWFQELLKEDTILHALVVWTLAHGVRGWEANGHQLDHGLPLKTEDRLLPVADAFGFTSDRFESERARWEWLCELLARFVVAKGQRGKWSGDAIAPILAGGRLAVELAASLPVTNPVRHVLAMAEQGRPAQIQFLHELAHLDAPTGHHDPVRLAKETTTLLLIGLVWLTTTGFAGGSLPGWVGPGFLALAGVGVMGVIYRPDAKRRDPDGGITYVTNHIRDTELPALAAFAPALADALGIRVRRSRSGVMTVEYPGGTRTLNARLNRFETKTGLRLPWRFWSLKGEAAASQYVKHGGRYRGPVSRPSSYYHSHDMHEGHVSGSLFIPPGVADAVAGTQAFADRVAEDPVLRRHFEFHEDWLDEVLPRLAGQLDEYTGSLGLVVGGSRVVLAGQRWTWWEAALRPFVNANKVIFRGARALVTEFTRTMASDAASLRFSRQERARLQRLIAEAADASITPRQHLALLEAHLGRRGPLRSGRWRKADGFTPIEFLLTILSLGVVALGWHFWPWLAGGLEPSMVLERGWGLWQVVAERVPLVKGLTGHPGVLAPLLLLTVGLAGVFAMAGRSWRSWQSARRLSGLLSAPHLDPLERLRLGRGRRAVKGAL